MFFYFVLFLYFKGEIEVIDENASKIPKVAEKDEKKREKKTTDIMVCTYICKMAIIKLLLTLFSINIIGF